MFFFRGIWAWAWIDFFQKKTAPNLVGSGLFAFLLLPFAFFYERTTITFPLCHWFPFKIRSV